MLLVDRLPAGFEIDNPKLVEGGSTDALAWLETDGEPAHTEFRDDRFVAAFDRGEDESAFFTVAYMVRAVAPGPLRPSARDGRGHVPPRPFRPHGFRQRWRSRPRGREGARRCAIQKAPTPRPAVPSQLAGAPFR